MNQAHIVIANLSTNQKTNQVPLVAPGLVTDNGGPGSGRKVGGGKAEDANHQSLIAGRRTVIAKTSGQKSSYGWAADAHQYAAISHDAARQEAEKNGDKEAAAYHEGKQNEHAKKTIELEELSK